MLPDDVWLESMTGTKPLAPPTPRLRPASAPPSSIPAAPSALTIQGHTYSQDGVAQLLARLEVVPDLKNVQLQTSKVDELGGRKIIDFTIVSDIRTGGDAA